MKAPAGLLLLCAAQGAQAQVISPRLDGVLAGKAIEPVAVEVWTTPGARLDAAIEIAPDRYLAQISPGQIAAIAGSGQAIYIAPADPIVPPQVEQDDQVTDKALVPGRPWPGTTGRGVKLGVIDFGTPPEGLPIAARHLFGETGPGPHMARVLTILHRLAPQAQLVVASLSAAHASLADVARAALWLESQGVRVITFSGVSYVNRRDGLAPLDQLVDQQSRRNVVWVAAAGNEAQRSWAGWSEDRNRDGLVDVAPGQPGVTLRASGGDVQIALTWDDWGKSGAPHGDWDCDLVITDATGHEVAAARTRRGRLGEPVKTVSLPRLAPGRYTIAMPLRGHGTPVRVRLVATGGVEQLSPSVPAESIGNPATAAGALAVSAFDERRLAATAYSDEGPTADFRAKPDLAASGRGGDGFAGTSYAAPRVAALIACLLEAQPGLTPVTIKAAIAAYAVPVATRRSAVGEAGAWIDSRGRD